MNSHLNERQVQTWLSTVPMAVILIAVILFSTSVLFNAKLSELAVKIWPDYYAIITPQAVPDCRVDVDIDQEIHKRLQRVDDDLDDFFDDAPALSEDALRESITNQLQACQARHAAYQFQQQSLTPQIQQFASFKDQLGDISRLTAVWGKVILLVLLFLSGLTASRHLHHIALRPIETLPDLQLATIAQALASVLMLYSSFGFYQMLAESGIAINAENNAIRHLYIIAFALLAAVNLFKLWQGQTRRIRFEKTGGYLAALLAVPLYAYMAIISAVVFFSNGSPTNMIIYFNKMLDLAPIFTNLALFVWVGMLLKQTRLASLIFDSLSVWKMPPEILSFVIILVSALPTAYTGGSAIYVIAAGSVIFMELRRAGSRRQLALATTAMSGSIGIVINPCLMLMLIGAMNNEVTASGIGGVGMFDFDRIQDWGLHTAGMWVMLLSASLFLLLALVINRPKMHFAPVAVALPQMLKRLVTIAPYALVIVLVLVIYAWGLDSYVNETSAPIILPAVMLWVLFYNQFYERKLKGGQLGIIKNYVLSINSATKETSYHVGALLMLMAMSMCLGGVVDSYSALSLGSGDNIWQTMLLLVFILVAIGMFMDPMGAIILVSLTIAKPAYALGINPLHFWMVTLVAFELGYLTPPVALNQLMTRQVVGEEEFQKATQESQGQHFYARHERILLPIIVMASTLLLVAFVPLALYA